MNKLDKKFGILIEFLKEFKEKASYVGNRKELNDLTKVFIAGGEISDFSSPSGKRRIMGLHQRINRLEETSEFAKLTGLILDGHQIDEKGIGRSKAQTTSGMPIVEVHNLKLVSRVGPKGNQNNQILVTLTQRRGVVCKSDEYGNVQVEGFFIPSQEKKGWFKKVSKMNGNPDEFEFKKMPYPGKSEGLTGEGSEKVLPEGWFIFRGGCTLIFDLNYNASLEGLDENNVKLKYIIKKGIEDEERMIRQYKLLFDNNDFSLNATYFGTPYGNLEAEPFAMIHKVL